MATKFWYPAFIGKVERLNNYLNAHQKDLVALNNITGTQLDELNALGTALNNIVKDELYPRYRESL